MNRLILSIFLFAVAGFANGQTSKQPAKATSAIWKPILLSSASHPIPKASVAKDMITALRISGLKIALEDTMLTEVQKQLGGSIGTEGDAGDYLAWLCYELNDDKGRSVLWLLSDEVDGGAVGGFQVRTIPKKQQIDGRCKKLQNSALEIPSAVQLGASQDQVHKALGRPSGVFGSNLQYVHEEQQSIKNQPFTETNTVSVVIRKGIISVLEVWKSTMS